MKRLFLFLIGILFISIPISVGAQSRSSNVAKEDSTVQALKIKLKNLNRRLQKLEEKQQKAELQRLLQEAETAAAQKPEAPPKTKVFRGGQRALQAINPEMSVTGDFLSHYIFESPHHYGDK